MRPSGILAGLATKFFRRKEIDTGPSTLARKLRILDLMGLGVGATLGAGVYVLTGVVARTEAGPAIILSFLISGGASVLSGLCYAEFGARVPRAGSAYVYSYVTVGEMLAWTTGWQLLLEYVIGASSVARSWSGYVDSLTGNAVSGAIANAIGVMNVPGLAAQPDFLGAGMTLLLSCVVAVGVKESTSVNNVLTAINVIVIVFVIIAGSFYAEPANFTPFAPFGAAGIFKGAATSFYAYVGFDVIATSAEEAINPSRTIPIGIIGSLILCAAAYVGVSAVVTLMVPYALLDPLAPLSSAFASHGANWAKYVISIGAVCGLSTSLMTCIFPMPRIVYAISNDGLLPPWVGQISPRFNTPVIATLLCGSFAAAMALIFDIDALADMMSIGTLLSYTLVAASVLVLRFREFQDDEDEEAARLALEAEGEGGAHAHAHDEGSAGGVAAKRSTGGAVVAPGSQPLLDDGELCAHKTTGGGYVFFGLRPFAAASWSLLVYSFGLSVASAMSVVLLNSSGSLSPAIYSVTIAFLVLGLLVALAGLVVLLLLPRGTPKNIAFTCPGMPAVPLVSIAINIYLLVSLSPLTWVRFGVWCFIGAAIYLGYGMHHSKVGLAAEEVRGAEGKRAAGGVGDEDEDAHEHTPLTGPSGAGGKAGR
jgi:amino acid transporter